MKNKQIFLSLHGFRKSLLRSCGDQDHSGRPGESLHGDGMEGFFVLRSASTGNFGVPGVKGKSPND